MKNRHRRTSLVAPWFWPLWAGFGLLWLISRLPVPWQIKIGKGIGYAFYPLVKNRRNIVDVNLRLCFPELDPVQRRRLARRHFAALGAGFIEVTMGWWSRTEQLRRCIHMEGAEHLRAAVAEGKGVILLSAHFTPLEIGGRLLSIACADVPYCAMYRPHENPIVEHMIKRNREKQFGTVIGRDDIRGVLRCLKNNRAVWYAPDQSVPLRRGKFVSFFGVPANTNTATSRLAKVSGAKVIPFFCERLADDSGYRVKLLPPLTDFPGDDDVADMEKIHRVFEAQIREVPEQYFWVHKRFKKRPPGEPSLYLK